MDALGLFVGALFAGSALLLVAAFVIGMIERQPVATFRDDPAPPPPGPYAEAMIASATSDFGYVWNASGVHASYPTIRADLLRSYDGRAIAMIAGGTLLRMPFKQTTLLTRRRDGRLITTTDLVGAAELDPATRSYFVMNGDFAGLCARHERALAAIDDAEFLPFADDVGWADVGAVSRARVARMVGTGRARYVGGDRTHYRHTLLGSLRFAFLNAARQIVTPQNYFRNFRRRPRRAARSRRSAGFEVAPRDAGPRIM